MRKLMAVGVCAASLLWGCVDQNHTLPPVAVSLPNGNPGAVVYCRAKSQCFQLSTEVCHGPYSIIQKDDKVANDFVTVENREGSEYIIQCTPKALPVAEAQK